VAEPIAIAVVGTGEVLAELPLVVGEALALVPVSAVSVETAVEGTCTQRTVWALPAFVAHTEAVVTVTVVGAV